jgi:hypothetical protein
MTATNESNWWRMAFPPTVNDRARNRPDSGILEAP